MTARRTPDPLDPTELEVVPATDARWPDVVELLGGNGERGCWCQSWRGAQAGFGRADPGANRNALQAQVAAGPPAPGVIAYQGSEPVGWCGLAPVAALPRLRRSRTIPRVDDAPVWAIGCFVVKAGFRRRGVARALLDGAVAYARSQGAPGIEAYPIDPGPARVSTSFGFTGFVPMFERAGFRVVAPTTARSAGLPRWVMRLDTANGPAA